MNHEATSCLPAGANEIRGLLSRRLPKWAEADVITGTALDFLAFYKYSWLESMAEDCAPLKTRRASNAVERDVMADKAMRAMEIIADRLRTPPQTDDSLDDLF